MYEMTSMLITVSAYTSTLANSDYDKEDFYSEMDLVVRSIL